jgi:hypothetical protein
VTQSSVLLSQKKILANQNKACDKMNVAVIQSERPLAQCLSKVSEFSSAAAMGA